MATANKFNFKEIQENLKVMKKRLPSIMANTGLQYFTNSFRIGSFDGKPWKEVQRRIPGTPEYKYPKKSDLQRHKRGILIGKTRNLLHDVAHSVRKKTWQEVVFGVAASYAAYHNEGSGKIPKRQFMGNSKELNDKLKKNINFEMKRMLTHKEVKEFPGLSL
jgi:phage gpG-like protein